jgi:hypothetical protein
MKNKNMFYFTIKKTPLFSLLIFFFVLFFGASAPTAFAATAPSLGTAGPYGIAATTLSNSNTSPQTIVNGSVCGTTLNVPLPLTITGTTDVPCASSVGDDQTAALATLNDVGQSCVSLGAAVALNAVTGHPTGIYTPGCYSSTGAMTITTGTTVTLDGDGVYIFKPTGALTTEADTRIVLQNGATAGKVFWAPVEAVSIGANTEATTTPTFIGNILDAAGITIGKFVNLLGRALAFGETITTDSNTITVPPNTYTLTYTAGAHGTITGTSPQTVDSGASGAEVIAVPSAGYHFTAWSDASSTANRTDTNVIADVTVTANFAIDTFTLTYTAGAHGTITGTSPQTVDSGASGAEVIAVPSAGYHFTAWSDASTTPNRTDTNVLSDVTVTANFAIDTHIVTSSTGAHGSISPLGVTSVDDGADQSFTITPDANYHVLDVLVDSVSVGGAVTSYSFANVTANHTIAVTYEEDAISVPTNGSVIPVFYLTRPPFSTHGDLQKLVVSLSQNAESLREQLFRIQKGNKIPAFPDTGSFYENTGEFTDNLSFGSIGKEVGQLQLFLKAQGPEIYPSGLVTDYFGLLTLKAVKAFHLKYDIAKAGSYGYGFVGPKTRAKINQILRKTL